MEEKRNYCLEYRECPQCGSKNLITDSQRAEIYCSDCGTVIAENIVDLGPEWLAYDEGQNSKRTRVGPPMTYKKHDNGLSTLPPISIIRSKRLKETINIVSSEKTLFFGLNDISRMASALGLPGDTIEEASLLYRKAAKQNLIKGHSIESIAIAALYIASKIHKIPRTPKEIEEILGSKRIRAKKINQEYFYLLEKLKLKTPQSHPIQYLPRFCFKLGLSADILSKATEICLEAAKAEIGIRQPERTAGASILMSLALNNGSNNRAVILKEILNLIGTSEYIIKTRYKELSKHLGQYLGQEEAGKVIKRNAKTIEELVNEIIIRNNVSDILERFDKEGRIKKTAIQVGIEFEKREEKGEITLNKNRKATATAALSIVLKKYLPWYKETLLNNGTNIKVVEKRKEIMREFGIINKK